MKLTLNIIIELFQWDIAQQLLLGPSKIHPKEFFEFFFQVNSRCYFKSDIRRQAIVDWSG